ncbi:MAG: diguanylate cyclase [Candidatus Rokuibacteriota bacterium]
MLLLGATVILQSASIREAVATSAPVFSCVIFGVGILLGWRFKRSQLIVALAVLFAAERTIALFPLAGQSPAVGRVVYAAVALLLPLNLAAIAWLSERTMSTWPGRLVEGAILIQPLAVALLLRPELSAVAQALQQEIGVGGLRVTRIPAPAVIAFLIAGALTGLRFAVRRTVIQASLAWGLFAALLGLHGEGAASTVYLASGGLVLIVSLIETSHRMAFSDELTGLPSRRALTDALMRLPDVYTIAMIDIDHFKKLNDEYGHAAGDQVLRMIGSTLTRTEGGGRPFRYGGEEFAVLFPGKAADEALPYLEDLREAIEASSFTLRGGDRPKVRPEKPVRSSGGRRKLAITVSIGVAEPDEAGAEPDDVIRAADQALYEAKRTGRNRICVA